MVVACTVLDLLVVGVDVLAERLGSAEIERCALHLQDFACGDGCVVDGDKEVGVDFANHIINRGCGVGNTGQREVTVVCEVDNRLLVCGGEILDDELIVVGE